MLKLRNGTCRENRLPNPSHSSEQNHPDTITLRSLSQNREFVMPSYKISQCAWQLTRHCCSAQGVRRKKFYYPATEQRRKSPSRKGFAVSGKSSEPRRECLREQLASDRSRRTKAEITEVSVESMGASLNDRAYVECFGCRNFDISHPRRRCYAACHWSD